MRLSARPCLFALLLTTSTATAAPPREVALHSLDALVLAIEFDVYSNRAAIVTAHRETPPSYKDSSAALYAWEPGAEPKLKMRFLGHRVNATGFAERGAALIVAVSDDTVHFWPIAEEQESGGFRLNQRIQATCVGSSADRQWLIGAQDPGKDPGHGGFTTFYTKAPPYLSPQHAFEHTTPVMVRWIAESTRYAVLETDGSVFAADAKANTRTLLAEPSADTTVSAIDVLRGRPEIALIGRGGFGVCSADAAGTVISHRDPGWTYHCCRLRPLSAKRETGGAYELWTVGSSASKPQEGVVEVWTVEGKGFQRQSSWPVGSYVKCRLSADCSHLLLSEGKTLRVLECSADRK